MSILMSFRYRPQLYAYIFDYCLNSITKKFVKILGSYSIDAFVMLKSVTNINFSSSTCLNF